MRNDRTLLVHIRDATTRILAYASDGREFFMSDTKTQDAIVRNLEIIGEASKNLSSELKTAHASVPWKQIAGMRDKLIHEYFGVNLALVWESAERDIPRLQLTVDAILDALEPS